MTTIEAPPERARPRGFRRLVRRGAKVLGLGLVALLVLVTAASFGYNLATDGPSPRPANLLVARGGGWETRYRAWGDHGTPIVLVPGAAETADTFARLGPVLAQHHRVFAIDLSGTGYSSVNPPFSAEHLADQVRAFLDAQRLTGADAPVLVGHSAGAADVGIAALRAPVRGVVFLDGDAMPFGSGSWFGQVVRSLLIDPYRTSAIRLAVRQDGLINRIYHANCGPACPELDEAGVNTWRLPLVQPGFQDAIAYALQHGITAMTPEQLTALHAAAVPKLVVAGADDPQMPAAAAARTAQRIGAPQPIIVPGRHLTMISSPNEVAAAIDALGNP